MPNNSYAPITNILSFAVAFDPSGAFPLDARSMFGSFSAAATAAASAEMPGSSNSKYYIGQQITVLENGIVSHYSIQPDKTLKAIGAQVVGDDKTITIGEDGKLSLKSFGNEYFAYHAADNIISGDGCTFPDNMPEGINGAFVKIGETWYKYSESAWNIADNNPITAAYYELTTGWKEGLEPKVVKNSNNTGFELAWYEPSSTTVEGLSSSIGALQASVDSIQSALNIAKSDLQTAIEEETERASEVENGLTTRVTATENSITTLNADAETEGSVKNIVATAVAKIMDNPDETLNSIQELVDWVNSHATEAITLSNNVTANSTAINGLQTLLGTSLPEGAVATNVIDYILEAVNVEKTRATTAETALGNRLTAVENSTTNLGTAAEKDVEYFATAEQGALADSAVQSVVAGESNGHISVDGTDVKVYEIEKATVTTLGGIKPDGSSITTDENGVASVSDVDVSKVTGLDTKINTAKTEILNDAKDYADTNKVDKTDIVTSANASENIEAASEGKVISEKLLYELLSWKTTM